MNHYYVLLPYILLEEHEPHFGIVENEKMKYAIIDEVYYNGSAEDARDGLVNHDGYSPYIILVTDK